MKKKYPLDKIAINVKSHKLLKNLLKENPKLEEIMRNARNETEALIGVRNWVYKSIQSRPQALKFYQLVVKQDSENKYKAHGILAIGNIFKDQKKYKEAMNHYQQVKDYTQDKSLINMSLYKKAEIQYRITAF